MRVVLQRSKAASVMVDGETVGAIRSGLVLLVGITHDDTEADARWMADKVAGLRMFEDASGKMNLSVRDTGGEILSVSQLRCTATAEAAEGRASRERPGRSRPSRCTSGSTRCCSKRD